MIVYSGLWFLAISALVVILVYCSHTLTNHYHQQIHKLVQNHCSQQLLHGHCLHTLCFFSFFSIQFNFRNLFSVTYVESGKFFLALSFLGFFCLMVFCVLELLPFILVNASYSSNHMLCQNFVVSALYYYKILGHGTTPCPWMMKALPLNQSQVSIMK